MLEIPKLSADETVALLLYTLADFHGRITVYRPVVSK
jgi:hypothetical protein